MSSKPQEGSNESLTPTQYSAIALRYINGKDGRMEAVLDSDTVWSSLSLPEDQCRALKKAFETAEATGAWHLGSAVAVSGDDDICIASLWDEQNIAQSVMKSKAVLSALHQYSKRVLGTAKRLETRHLSDGSDMSKRAICLGVIGGLTVGQAITELDAYMTRLDASLSPSSWTTKTADQASISSNIRICEEAVLAACAPVTTVADETEAEKEAFVRRLHSYYDPSCGNLVIDDRGDVKFRLEDRSILFALRNTMREVMNASKRILEQVRDGESQHGPMRLPAQIVLSMWDRETLVTIMRELNAPEEAMQQVLDKDPDEWLTSSVDEVDRRLEAFCEDKYQMAVKYMEALQQANEDIGNSPGELASDLAWGSEADTAMKGINIDTQVLPTHLSCDSASAAADEGDARMQPSETQVLQEDLMHEAGWITVSGAKRARACHSSEAKGEGDHAQFADRDDVPTGDLRIGSNSKFSDAGYWDKHHQGGPNPFAAPGKRASRKNPHTTTLPEDWKDQDRSSGVLERAAAASGTSAVDARADSYPLSKVTSRLPGVTRRRRQRPSASEDLVEGLARSGAWRSSGNAANDEGHDCWRATAEPVEDAASLPRIAASEECPPDHYGEDAEPAQPGIKYDVLREGDAAPSPDHSFTGESTVYERGFARYQILRRSTADEAATALDQPPFQGVLRSFTAPLQKSSHDPAEEVLAYR